MERSAKAGSAGVPAAAVVPNAPGLPPSTPLARVFHTPRRLWTDWGCDWWRNGYAPALAVAKMGVCPAWAREQVGSLEGLVVEEPVLVMPAELDEEFASEGKDPLAARWGRDRFAPVDPVGVTRGGSFVQ